MAQKDEAQCGQHNKTTYDQGLPGSGFRWRKQYDFMLEQIPCKYINQAFGDQSDQGAQKIAAPGNPAQGKTEIDDIGGQNVYSPAEYNGPQAVFVNSFIDTFDQFLLPVSLAEIGGKYAPDHEEGRHYCHQVNNQAKQQGRSQGQHKAQSHRKVEDGKTGQGT